MQDRGDAVKGFDVPGELWTLWTLFGPLSYYFSVVTRVCCTVSHLACESCSFLDVRFWVDNCSKEGRVKRKNTEQWERRGAYCVHSKYSVFTGDQADFFLPQDLRSLCHYPISQINKPRHRYFYKDEILVHNLNLGTFIPVLACSTGRKCPKMLF